MADTRTSQAASPASPEQPVAANRASWRLPHFQRYLFGLTADVVGDQVWFIALAWAATRAGDPATAGGVVSVGTIPRMLVFLPAGAVVDRFGALRVAQLAQLVRVVAMLATIGVAIAAPTSVPLLMALAVTFGLADALRLPAANALPLGAVSLSVYRPRRRPVVAGLVWSAVSAVAIAALGFAGSLAVSAVIAAVGGSPWAQPGALLLGAVQATTASRYQGRVMSLVSFSSFGLTLIALAGFGYLANVTELPLAFLITGGSVAALTVAGAFAPSLRRFRLPGKAEEAAAPSAG